jgi:hypothetical protein
VTAWLAENIDESSIEIDVAPLLDANRNGARL